LRKHSQSEVRASVAAAFVPWGGLHHLRTPVSAPDGCASPPAPPAAPCPGLSTSRRYSLDVLTEPAA